MATHNVVLLAALGGAETVPAARGAPRDSASASASCPALAYRFAGSISMATATVRINDSERSGRRSISAFLLEIAAAASLAVKPPSLTGCWPVTR